MLQYLKRQAMKLRSGLTKGIVLLLCLATPFSSAQLGGLALIAEAAEGEHSVLYAGKATTSVTLPQDDKLTLTVEEKKDATYAWQLCADKDADQWVTISGQKQDFLTLSYAMVASLLDSRGVTYVRSVITGSAGASVSQPVAVRVSYVVPDAAASSAPSVSAPRKAAVRYNAPIGADLTTYTITVKFVYADGTLVADPYVATIEAGGAFTTTVKFPESVGYLPYWESDEQSTTERMLTFPSIDQDYTYTVTYKPTIVKYQVHHLIQNILDDNYTLYTTTEKQGLNGSLIADCAIDIDGFSALYYDKDVKIAADGSTEVEVYYDRNYYLVSFDLNGGYGVDPIYTRYGATVSVGKPTRPGYVFDGWKLVSCGGETPTADQEAAYSLVNSITVPFMNLKYQAQWKTSDTTYTVVYWIQNANDDNYSYYDSKKVNATSAEIVNGSTFGQAETIRHFTFNADKTDKNVIVEGDGSTVVNVYYTRNTYTLTFKDGQKTLTCTKTEHKHSDSCCKFGGTGISHWYHRDSCCKLGLSEHTHSNSCYKTSDLTITAKYQADIHGNFPIKDGNDTIWWKVPNGTETYGDSDEQRYLGSIDTMPGEDISFDKYDSESGAKIYYYVETLNGEAGDTTYNGKNYKQYKVIDLDYSSYTNLTYAEEFHPITGFTQGDSNPYLPEGGSVRMNRNNYLYYTRNSYNLKFYNYNAFVDNKQASVQYEAPLNGYNFTPDYPNDMEPNGYEFAGWYTTPQCFEGSKVDFTTKTMPASDVTLYAKWAPKTHTVRVFKTVDMTEQIGDSQSVPHGSLGKAPEEPSNGNYVFAGWFYMDGTEKKAFDFNNMPVNRDLDIFAEWSSKTAVKYTIHYTLADGTLIADDTVGSTLAGTSKTFTAKAGNQLYADYQEGYFPNTNSHTILMNIDGKNEFTFVYKQMENVPYTVRYLEKSTGNVLHEEKRVENNKKSVVTETFVPITGYMPDAYQKRLVLSANSEENVLEFLYTKDSENAYYMIVHWVQNLEGDGYTEYRTIQSPGKIGNIITEEPLSIAGFTYNEEKSTASGTITAEGLVLNLYYDRNMYSYTVKYLEAGTDKELSDSKVSSASYRYGTVVSEEAVNIPGYKLVSEPHKTLTINNRTDGNVIKFYYQEQNVTINYIPVPLDAGTVSTGTETIKAFTGVSLGSVPTPKDGYRFVGWYTDTQCTTPVPSDWVDSNNKLTPQKQDGTYHAASYFAKFEKATASLTIQKTGWDEVDENQAFLFHVKGIDEKNKDIDMIVTVYGNGKSTIADLPIGKYDVSEQTNWSWRYTPKSGLQTITLVPSGGTLTFENSRTQTQWLDGDNYSVNHFDSKNQ